MADVSSGSTDIKVTVSGQGKSREYTFHISQDISTPVLANMTLSTSNTYSNTANRISLSPEFSSATTSYRAIYKESREFLNIFAEPADSSASVTAVGIRGTSKVTVLGKVTGSGAAHRIAMYFDKTNPEAEAEVKVTVTTKSGKTTDYTIVVQRTDTPSPTPTVTPVPDTRSADSDTNGSPGGIWPLDNRIGGNRICPGNPEAHQQQGKNGNPYSGK